MKKSMLCILLCLCTVLLSVPAAATEQPGTFPKMEGQADANTFRVTLDTKGGTITDGENITSYVGGEEKLLPTVVRPGYFFNGWYEQSNMSQPVTKIESTDRGNKTFIAKWLKEIRTVTIENDGHGTGDYEKANIGQAGDIGIGDKIYINAKPNRGYYFDSWEVLSGDVSIVNNSYFVMGAQDVVLKAHFAPYVFSIRVENDGNGIAYASAYSAVMGEQITLTAIPNTGYHFKEWQSNEPVRNNVLTVDLKNVVVTAIFEKDFSEKVFSDVKESDWFYSEVQYVYQHDLMNGTGKGFEPQSKLTRAQMMTILWRMDGSPKPSKAASFTDVQAGAWYADAVAWAQENNISNGYGDTFGTNDAITREQMVTMFRRFAQYKGYDVSAKADLSAYTDNGSVSSYAAEPMQWAVGVGLMKGRTDTTLEPQGTATRAEAATIMHRFDTLVTSVGALARR